MSIYPIGIDGEAQLPTTIDNVTGLDQNLLNGLRVAIINAESELGIMPSSTFPTVRARLDAIDGLVASLQAQISAGAVLPTFSGNQYDVLMENPVGQSSWGCLRPGLLCPDLAITGLSEILYGTLVELGSSILNPSFSATYSLPTTTVVISDSTANPSLDVSGSPNAFVYANTYTSIIYGNAVSWTLTASDGVQTDISTISKTWTQKVFYGVGPAGQSSELFIEGLTGVLATSRARTFTVTAGATDKIYYAYRNPYGIANFSVGGFAGGFTLVNSAILITNAFGVAESYSLYESDNLGLGVTTVVVT